MYYAHNKYLLTNNIFVAVKFMLLLFHAIFSYFRIRVTHRTTSMNSDKLLAFVWIKFIGYLTIITDTALNSYPIQRQYKNYGIFESIKDMILSINVFHEASFIIYYQFQMYLFRIICMLYQNYQFGFWDMITSYHWYNIILIIIIIVIIIIIIIIITTITIIINNTERRLQAALMSAACKRRL